MRVNGSGTADLQRVRAEYDLPLFERVSGTTNFKLAVDAHEQRIGWIVESSLEGATIDLPAPLHKNAADKVALRVERREPRAGEDRIVVDYGPAARVVLSPAPRSAADRSIGRSCWWARLRRKPPMRSSRDCGFEATCRSSTSTRGLRSTRRAGADASGPAPAGATGVERRRSDGRRRSMHWAASFTKLRTSARRQSSDWRLTLDGTELAGTAVWRGATPAQPNGRIVARLARLTTPPASDAAANRCGAPATAFADALQSLAGSGHRRRRAALEGPHARQARVARAPCGQRLADPEARADQRFRPHRRRRLVAQRGEPIADDGSTSCRRRQGGRRVPRPLRLAQRRQERADEDRRPAVRGTARRATSTIRRSPAASSFARVPGSSRRSIPASDACSACCRCRRCRGESRSISATCSARASRSTRSPRDVRMRNGVMHTDDFRLVGPAAAVNIAGDVDLARETQQLKVRVQPSLSSGVSRRRGRAVHRQPADRRGGRRGHAARAEDAQQSVRPAVQLRVCGDRQLG